MISKRTFLRNALFGAIGLAGFGLINWKLSKPEDIVVAILKKNLDQLNIENKAFEEFAQSYLAHKREHEKKLKILSGFSHIYHIVSPYHYLKMGHPLRKLENNIISNFMLSTDFFTSGSDTSRPITYMGFYDPYKSPCRMFFR